jgi:hypothetical protein
MTSKKESPDQLPETTSEDLHKGERIYIALSSELPKKGYVVSAGGIEESMPESKVKDYKIHFPGDDEIFYISFKESLIVFGKNVSEGASANLMTILQKADADNGEDNVLNVNVLVPEFMDTPDWFENYVEKIQLTMKKYKTFMNAKISNELELDLKDKK